MCPLWHMLSAGDENMKPKASHPPRHRKVKDRTIQRSKWGTVNGTDLSKGVPRSSGGDSPTAPVVRVRPHQVAHRTLVGHLINPIHPSIVTTTEGRRGGYVAVRSWRGGRYIFLVICFDRSPRNVSPQPETGGRLLTTGGWPTAASFFDGMGVLYEKRYVPYRGQDKRQTRAGRPPKASWKHIRAFCGPQCLCVDNTRALQWQTPDTSHPHTAVNTPLKVLQVWSFKHMYRWIRPEKELGTISDT